MIIISILLHHYKEFKECINQVEQIEAKVNNNNNTSYRGNFFGENIGVIESDTLRVQFDYNFTQGRKVSDTVTTLKNHTT